MSLSQPESRPSSALNTDTLSLSPPGSWFYSVLGVDSTPLLLLFPPGIPYPRDCEDRSCSSGRDGFRWHMISSIPGNVIPLR